MKIHKYKTPINLVQFHKKHQPINSIFKDAITSTIILPDGSEHTFWTSPEEYKLLKEWDERSRYFDIY